MLTMYDQITIHTLKKQGAKNAELDFGYLGNLYWYHKFEQ